jgi:hypothetical protein
MRPLRYSINVTVDGCCDRREMVPDEDLHRHAAENIDRADALLFGRVTYEMMEAAWRPPVETGARPEWMNLGWNPLRGLSTRQRSTSCRAPWTAGGLERGARPRRSGDAVQQLKQASGNVQPRLVGHGPTLFAGLSKHVDLKLVGRLEFGSGAVAMRYEPSR